MISSSWRGWTALLTLVSGSCLVAAYLRSRAIRIMAHEYVSRQREAGREQSRTRWNTSKVEEAGVNENFGFFGWW